MARRIFLFAFSFLCLAIDQILKSIVSAPLLVNRSFAWGLPLSNTLTICLSAGVLGALAIFYFISRQRRNIFFPLTLIFAGALSNLFDRIWRGGVIDYLAVPGGGIINLADIMIGGGVILLVIKYKNKH